MIYSPKERIETPIQPEVSSAPEQNRIFDKLSIPDQTFILNGRALIKEQIQDQINLLLETIKLSPRYLAPYYTARALDMADGGNRLSEILITLSEDEKDIPEFADILAAGFFDQIISQPYIPDNEANDRLFLVFNGRCHVINYNPKEANPAERTRYLGDIEDPRLIAMLEIGDASAMPPIAQGIYRDRLKGSKVNRTIYYLNPKHNFLCKSVITSSKVFGWAIDTVDVVDTLVELEEKGVLVWGDIEDAAELGTGTGGITGTLTKILSRQSLRDGKKRTLYGADINTHAIKHTEAVVAAEREAPEELLTINIVENGNLLADLIASETKLNLLISNPPYIPMPSEQRVDEYKARGEQAIMAAIQDIELYIQMFTLGKQVLAPNGKILFLASSVSSEEVIQMAKDNGFEVEQITDWKSVPLDLAEINNSPKWLEMILENKGVFNYNEIYPFGHNIAIFVASLPKNEQLAESIEA